MKHIVHRQVLREGRYELWFEVMDDSGKLLFGGQRPIGKKQLDKAELGKLFTDVIYPEVEAMLNAPPPERTMTESEVEDMLVDKGYLAKGDSLDDLPDKIKLEK